MAEANEVEGRKESTIVDDGSRQVSYCNVCPDVKATSFCEDCHEYMCTDCTSYHKRITATKTHTLLINETFPLIPSAQRPVKADTSQKCPDHPKEDITVYCQTHVALCCVGCVFQSHENCAKQYIPDFEEAVKTDPDIGTLNLNIGNTEERLVKGFDDIETSLKEVKRLKADEFKKLRMYRARIIEYLDKQERELESEMQQIQDKDVTLLNELKVNLKTRQSTLNDTRVKLNAQGKTACEYFIAAKKACGDIAQLQSSVHDIGQKIEYQRYSVVPDIQMEKILQDKGALAELALTSDVSATTLVPLPNLTLETEDLNVFCMTLVSEDTLLFSDATNKKIILFDKGNGKQLSEILLRASPRIICMVGNNQAVTSTSDKYIQWINISSKVLTTESETEVDVDVFGVDGFGNNFVLSHQSPPGVAIIDKDGKVIHKIDNVISGRELFKCPRWITTPPDGSIYVTDRGTRQIFRFDACLTVLQSFSGELLSYPVGITYINKDQLLVCNKDNNNVLLIRPSTNSMTVLLDKQHGIYCPTSLGYCEKQKKLYIAPYGKTHSVLVYKLT